MATIKERSITVARNYLRDFPQFFQMDFTPAGRTYELSSPNIIPTSLWVAYVPNSASAGTPAASAGSVTLTAAQYDLDSRNSILRLKTPVVDAYKILVEGYHYEWLNDDDLDFYADMAINLLTHNLTTSVGNLAPVVVDLMGVLTLVEALWGLVSEFSRDIDVITSESVHISASQRYRMVQGLLSYWQEEYRKRAQALNVGLDRIEVFTLRRRSHTTERLVPVYREREVGDYSPIERLWPAIDSGMIHVADEGDPLREDVFVEGDPPVTYASDIFFQ
jgi:hypothetical protein